MAFGLRFYLKFSPQFNPYRNFFPLSPRLARACRACHLFPPGSTSLRSTKVENSQRLLKINPKKLEVIWLLG